MSGFASIPLQLGRILSVTRNLQQLDLRASASALTDNVMRVICCYLTQLTHLNVKGCHQVSPLNHFFNLLFRKDIVDYLVEQINDPSWVWYCSFMFLPATPSSSTLEGLFELTRLPSRLLNLTSYIATRTSETQYTVGGVWLQVRMSQKTVQNNCCKPW